MTGAQLNGPDHLDRGGDVDVLDLSPDPSSHDTVTVGTASRLDVAAPVLRLEQLSKAFGHGRGSVVALDRIDLSVRPGEFVCLVGASGCGKSTLLNVIAGLDRPTGGTIETNVDRSALMFQESALFPWLDVISNVEMAMKLRKVPKAERRSRALELLRLVHLEEWADRRPHELSGGMRQRAALARALAQDAKLLLMDEPFGALDAITRDILHDELERIWAEAGLTVLFVTHSVPEAVRLGDRVIVLSSRPGRIAAQFEVEADRPRRSDSHVVADLAAEITEQLRSEVRRHVSD